MRPREVEALSVWAADGHLLDNAEFTARWLEQGQLGGAEHEVFFDSDKQRWYKRNSLTYHSNYLEYFHRLALHNYLFPEAPVRFEGMTVSDEILMPVLSQATVWVDRGASRAETEAAMRRLGLERQRDDNYYHPTFGVLAEDLHDENVVIGEDGELFVIDPALYLDDWGKGKRLRMHAEGQP